MPRARRATPAAIRPATAADVPALGRMGAKLARAHHAWDPSRFFLPEEPVEDGYAWWLGKELKNRRAVVLVAEVPARARAGGRDGAAPPGEIVGYAYGRLEPRDWNMLRDACGEAVDLWVEPGARRAGLGARLVDALAAALEARGAARVVLYVAARNPVARRLFRALAFRPTMLEMARERRPADAAALRRRSPASRRAAPRSRPGRASRTR